jgi:hypothetical protein
MQKSYNVMRARILGQTGLHKRVLSQKRKREKPYSVKHSEFIG